MRSIETLIICIILSVSFLIYTIWKVYTKKHQPSTYMMLSIILLILGGTCSWAVIALSHILHDAKTCWIEVTAIAPEYSSEACHHFKTYSESNLLNVSYQQLVESNELGDSSRPMAQFWILLEITVLLIMTEAIQYPLLALFNIIGVGLLWLGIREKQHLYSA